MSAFFKNLIHDKNTDGIPKYIHIDDNIHVCMDAKEALHWWVVSKAEMHMLQKYIAPCKKRLQKLRVYWKAKTGLRFLVVSTISPMPIIQAKPKKRTVKNIGMYQHKIKDYAFAGRLLRASFDPTLPNKSLINSQSESLISESKIEEVDQDIDKHFLVRFNDKYMTSVNEVPMIEVVKDIVMAIIQCVNNSSNGNVMMAKGRNRESDGDNLVISEIIVDFLLDKTGKWVFIGCKAFKLDYMPTKYNALFPLKTLNSNSLNRYEEFLSRPTNEPFLSVASLTSRLNSLGKRSSEIFKSPKVNFKNLSPQIYISHISELNLSHTPNYQPLAKDKLTDIYSTQINRIAEHYDKIRSMARKNKVDLVRRKTIILTESILFITVKKILDRLQLSNDLKKIVDIGEGFFPQFFAKVMDEEKNMEFFLKFQQNYEWKLTMKQYRMLNNIILEECKKTGLFCGNDTQALVRALEKFEAFIFKYNYTHD